MIVSYLNNFLVSCLTNDQDPQRCHNPKPKLPMWKKQLFKVQIHHDLFQGLNKFWHDNNPSCPGGWGRRITSSNLDNSEILSQNKKEKGMVCHSWQSIHRVPVLFKKIQPSNKHTNKKLFCLTPKVFQLGFVIYKDGNLTSNNYSYFYTEFACDFVARKGLFARCVSHSDHQDAESKIRQKSSSSNTLTREEEPYPVPWHWGHISRAL